MRKLIIATVVKASPLSPNMIRIRLHSEDIKAFPSHCEGGHLKLVIPPSRCDSRQLELFLNSFTVRKTMRTYTIRHFDSATGVIDIDFVAHGDNGPASAWALSAKAGDCIGISSPGNAKLKNSNSGKYLIAVDMSAFPAAAASVEKLPADAHGDFYTEILSQADVQPINAPAGINIHWIVDDKSGKSDVLTQAVKTQKLAGDESIFVAGEYESVSSLRAYFKTEKRYPRDQLYISSYWKKGLVESQHKRVKTLVA